MKEYWEKEIEKWKKLVFLAPMDWYTDSAYRQVVKKVAPHIYCVSEFFSADWIVYSKFLADAVLTHDIIEEPLVIQIFWKSPEIFVEASKKIANKKYNIAWIDVNMWCPAKKVVRSWHWSSLMINEEAAFEIIKSMNQAVDLPISVKTRLSFDWTGNLINFVSWLEKAWASLVTVHWRTAKQWYTWVADFTQIYELKNHVAIPIICNWDILNFEDWMKKVKNLDWFMIWRASFWNPWCFVWEEHINNKKYLEITWLNKDNFMQWAYHASLEEIISMMEFHAEKLVETKWEKKGSLEIRKHLVQYLKNFPWVKKYRKKLVTTESLENTREILEEIKSEFKDYLKKRPSLWEIDLI